MKIIRVLCATLESFAVKRKNTISLTISPFVGVIHQQTRLTNQG